MQANFAERMKLVKPSSIRELLKLAADPEVISFGGGFPDPEIFPIEKLQNVFSEVLAKHGKQALQYAQTEGLPQLRKQLVARMNKAGVDCNFEQLFITQGAQQGLDLMAKMFINKGDVIVVEKPSFLGALIAFNPYEPKYTCVSMDKEGMNMDELEQVLKTTSNVKFIYTVPDFQNPTGITTSIERRKRLVELANTYDVMILEDSPYREIRYEGEVLAPIKSFDTQGRVVYLGSFSKILSPGMRLGWIVANKELAEKFVLLKQAADTQNSTLNMYAASVFMEMYDIDDHIAILRKEYKEKKDIMLKTIDETFPKCVSYTNPEGGLFTWLTFPEGTDSMIVMQEHLLPKAKVAYVPSIGFYAVNPELNHCRMNYSCMSRENIVNGITKMGDILNKIFA